MGLHVFDPVIKGLEVLTDRTEIFQECFINGNIDVIIPGFTSAFNPDVIITLNGVDHNIEDDFMLFTSWMYADEHHLVPNLESTGSGEFLFDSSEIDQETGLITITYFLYVDDDSIEMMLTGYVVRYYTVGDLSYCIFLVNSIETP